uniref:Uncharacterized protein n=1 Tax=Anguilla anguilla TaxID=7936 RepID=A0A0E9T951_ANGAN
MNCPKLSKLSNFFQSKITTMTVYNGVNVSNSHS